MKQEPVVKEEGGMEAKVEIKTAVGISVCGDSFGHGGEGVPRRPQGHRNPLVAWQGIVLGKERMGFLGDEATIVRLAYQADGQVDEGKIICRPCSKPISKTRAP